MNGEPDAENFREASAEGLTPPNYLPRYRRFAFDNRSARPFPGVTKGSAAVLKSDIVGFTLLTDNMVRNGIAGAEKLAEAMNHAIKSMAKIAFEHGGEMTSWEGDAGTFVWFAHAGLPLEESTLLAIQAALAIHREAGDWLIDGAPIQFRSAVSCGALSHFEIGGKDGEWHAVLTGLALSEVSATQRAASPGQALVSRSAFELVGARCQLVPSGDGMAHVVAVAAPAELPRDQAPPDNIPLQALRRAAPQILLNSSRQLAVWEGEFRVVTVAYMTLRSPEYEAPEDTLATLQDAAQRVQSCLARFEGQIYLTVAAEEGVTFIAVFGLPPWSHEDDAARGVRASLALHREWGALGLTSSSGIATGRIFCGAFNTTTGHIGLALVGPVMNLAARFMQLNAGVVCDERTRQSGRQSGRILARRLTPRTIKGKVDPIVAFAAYDVADASEPAALVDDVAMIGRAPELNMLTSSLARTRSGTGAVAILEGDAGIGKTTLANRVATIAGASGFVVLVGAGDSTDQTTAYLAWRRVIRDLLARSDLKFPAAGLLSSGSNELRLSMFERQTPLLDEMLGHEVLDNGETALLRGQARADALARLLQQMLLQAAKAAPVLVIIEDLQWLDPTSLALFAALGSVAASMMLLGATRGPDANPAVRRSLAGAASAQWLRLEPLDADETGRLLARTLGVRQADKALAAMFRDRTGGNPLFVEELSRMAAANGLLTTDGVVRSRVSVEAANLELDEMLQRQGLPGTIEGVIRRRLDSLPAQEVIVLRAASVVGDGFDRDRCAAGAQTLTQGEVERSIAALIGLGLVEPSNQKANSFAFRHAVLRDVVYNAMAFAERRRLHEAIGGWMEAHPQGEDASAVLGRHFLHAQRNDKAVRYLTTAGEIAVRRYANEEAAELLTRADEVAATQTGDNAGVSAAERARLSLLLGRALLGLSRYDECRRHNESGLQLAGFATPKHRFGVALGLLPQAFGLVRQRVWARRVEASATRKAVLREVVLGFEALAETYFFSGDSLRTLHAALTLLNQAERLGPCAELARGCATLSGITGFLRMNAASSHYAARATKSLVGLDDPAAETWVFTLLGLSARAAGRWSQSAEFFANVVAAATRNGDRRRWRDGVEGGAVNRACRGDWSAALVGLSEMFDSAEQDRDRRYLVMAFREATYCRLQLGDFAAVRERLDWIKREAERDLGTEEFPTWLDYHAFAATVALAAGDFAQAAHEAEAARKAVADIGGKSSVTNTYWSLFLVARAFGALWGRSTRLGVGDPGFLKAMAATCRALSRQAWSFPIAGAAAALAQGHLARLRGRETTAAHLFRRAAARAARLGLSYEAQLARHALGEDGGAEVRGLAFLVEEAADAR